MPQTISIDLGEQPVAFIDRVLRLLRRLGITELSIGLQGCGDSGDATLDHILYADGRSETHFPDLPIGISVDGHVKKLGPYLEDFAAERPEGDWVNNEGGYGTVTFHPFEEDPDFCIDCDMTYRDEGDYGEDDQQDDEDWQSEDDPLDNIAIAIPFDLAASDRGAVPPHIIRDEEPQP